MGFVLGTYTRSFSLINSYSLTETNVSVDPQVSYVSVGDTAELSCSVLGGSNNTFSWTHLIGGLASLVGSNDPVLRVSINTTAEGGTYQCTVDSGGQANATVNGKDESVSI